jgi:hypothetical protein
VLVKNKAALRKAKARTYNTLTEAMKNALDAVPPAVIAGWFNHCGYIVNN